MKTFHHPHTVTRVAASALLIAVLSACGGGSGSADSTSTPQSTAATGSTARALSVKASSQTASATAVPAPVTLATEGGSFTVTGTHTVQYGAGSSWIQMSVTGTGQCTNAFFGSDPDFGVVKSCQLVSDPTVTVTTIATEGQSFTVSGTQTVQFGVGSTWVQQSVTGTGQCTVGFFGSDPAMWVPKTCQLVSSTAPAPTAPAAPTTIAQEGQSFTVTGTQTVQFGFGTAWVTMQVTGTGQCTIGFFGSDPAMWVPKICQIVPSTVAVAAPPSSANSVTAWVRVGNFGEALTLNGTRTVRFGDGYNWVTASLSTGAACTPSSFGKDPAPYTPEFCEAQVTAPAVTQTGTAPVVNTALTPATALSYTAPRVMTLTAAQLSNANFQPVATDVGAFRDLCNFSHMNFDDPIAFPGKVGASHMHTYMGNDAANAASTATSMQSTGGSTCAGGTVNRTGYWMPTLIDTRTGQPLTPIDGQMYYKSGYQGVTASTIKPFPPGLRMIAGTSTATAAITSLARWACLSSGGWQASIPSCAPGDNLMASVTFPQCWDGVNLDSPDHKSHMAYGTGTGCPADHPVALPEVSIRYDYKVSEANSGNWLKVSSDNYSGPGGYSIHADWFYGWDNATHATFVTNCISASLDCHDYLLGDGRMLY